MEIKNVPNGKNLDSFWSGYNNFTLLGATKTSMKDFCLIYKYRISLRAKQACINLISTNTPKCFKVR